MLAWGTNWRAGLTSGALVGALLCGCGGGDEGTLVPDAGLSEESPADPPTEKEPVPDTKKPPASSEKCDEGFYDQNDDSSDGCEYACTGDPSAEETCDGSDTDCDGTIDEGFDVDGDGFSTCGTIFTGGVDSARVDCDDSEASTFPGATEICDGIDQDCDTVDDNDVTAPAGLCATLGVCAGTVPTCSGSGGWTCSYPGTHTADEGAAHCDGADNDCDGTTDEGMFL